MLETLGYILNVIFAGLLLPVMLLPLARLLQKDRSDLVGASLWFGLVIVLITVCIIFAVLTPRLNGPDTSQWKFITLISILSAAVTLTGFKVGLERFAGRFSKIAQACVSGAGRSVMWLLLTMVIIQFGVVVLRYVFGINFIFMQESITYMHGAVFLLAAGYALLTNDHVRVDIFYQAASPRRKALIDFIGTYFFLVPMCLVIIWAAGPYVANAWAVQEGSTESSGIQGVFLLKSLIPLFATFLMLAGFTKANEASITMREKV